MAEITSQYIDRYYNEYDDTDRYFDYLYDFYQHINDYVEDRALHILNNNNFDDFFKFCLDHMDREITDHKIMTEHINQLQYELGKYPKNISFNKRESISEYSDDDSDIIV